MSLLDKLTGVEQPKLPVHQFWAAMDEYAGGHISEEEFKAAFGIVDGTDLTEWEWLKGRYTVSTNKPDFLVKMHTLFMLAERRLFNYQDKSVLSNRISSMV